MSFACPLQIEIRKFIMGLCKYFKMCLIHLKVKYEFNMSYYWSIWARPLGDLML
jgi:hypothetical protein